MPKFKVSLPFTERIIEADDDEEACDRFRNDETIFYEIETEQIDEAEPAKEAEPALEIDPALFDFLGIVNQATEKLSGADPTLFQKAPRKAPGCP